MIKNLLFKKISNWYLAVNHYIQSKEKRPLFAYLFSEILFFFVMKFGQNLAKEEYYKLDFDSICKYYDMYGYDATLKRFKLNKVVLDKIIS